MTVEVIAELPVAVGKLPTSEGADMTNDETRAELLIALGRTGSCTPQTGGLGRP